MPVFNKAPSSSISSSPLTQFGTGLESALQLIGLKSSFNKWNSPSPSPSPTPSNSPGIFGGAPAPTDAQLSQRLGATPGAGLGNLPGNLDTSRYDQSARAGQESSARAQDLKNSMADLPERNEDVARLKRLGIGGQLSPAELESRYGGMPSESLAPIPESPAIGALGKGVGILGALGTGAAIVDIGATIAKEGGIGSQSQQKIGGLGGAIAGGEAGGAIGGAIAGPVGAIIGVIIGGIIGGIFGTKIVIFIQNLEHEQGKKIFPDPDNPPPKPSPTDPLDERAKGPAYNNTVIIRGPIHYPPSGHFFALRVSYGAGHTGGWNYAPDPENPRAYKIFPVDVTGVPKGPYYYQDFSQWQRITINYDEVQKDSLDGITQIKIGQESIIQFDNNPAFSFDESLDVGLSTFSIDGGSQRSQDDSSQSNIITIAVYPIHGSPNWEEKAIQYPKNVPPPPPPHNEDEQVILIFSLAPWEERLTQATVDTNALIATNATLRSQISAMANQLGVLTAQIIDFVNTIDQYHKDQDDYFDWYGRTEFLLDLLELVIKILQNDAENLSIGDTLAQIATNVVTQFGIDLNGLSITGMPDIASMISSSLPAHDESWFSSNRIYQSYTNLYSAFQQISVNTRKATEVISGTLASWGNALKKYGVVSRDAYPDQNPTANFSTPGINDLENH